MKLVTACGDQTSKLCNLHPSGKLDGIREFVNNSSVKSVMFCPGSSGKYYYDYAYLNSLFKLIKY